MVLPDPKHNDNLLLLYNILRKILEETFLKLALGGKITGVIFSLSFSFLLFSTMLSF